MKLLTLLFTLLSLHAWAQQDTLRITLGEYQRQHGQVPGLTNTHLIVYDSLSKRVEVEGDFLNNKHNGLLAIYNNNIIWRMSTYKNDVLDGECWVYYKNGNVDRRDVYINGKVVSGLCFDDEGHQLQYYTEPLTYVEQFPRPPYDVKRYLKKNLKYPDSSRNAGVQGQVIVKFVVFNNGQIYNPTIVKSLDKACDDEAKRLINAMPFWNPAFSSDQNVNCYYSLPIDFKL